MGASTASLRNMAHVSRPALMKREAIASSAVRAAEKVQASLIVVYTESGEDFEIRV